jgi:hypothetical protein
MYSDLRWVVTEEIWGKDRTRIFGTRTKECNRHHGSHFGTLRGDGIIAQLTLFSAKI